MILLSNSSAGSTDKVWLTVTVRYAARYPIPQPIIAPTAVPMPGNIAVPKTALAKVNPVVTVRSRIERFIWFLLNPTQIPSTASNATIPN